MKPKKRSGLTASGVDHLGIAAMRRRAVFRTDKVVAPIVAVCSLGTPQYVVSVAEVEDAVYRDASTGAVCARCGLAGGLATAMARCDAPWHFSPMPSTLGTDLIWGLTARIVCGICWSSWWPRSATEETTDLG